MSRVHKLATSGKVTLSAIVMTSAILSGCSRSTESIETTDVFPPDVQILVPQPDFPVAPPINTGSLNPVPFPVAPSQPVFPDPGLFVPTNPEPVPFEPTQFEPVVTEPTQPIFVTEPPTIVTYPQPVPTPPTVVVTYDCSIMPVAKSELTIYRANCL